MSILLSFIIAISFILITLNHPLRMGLILIIQTLIVSSIIGYMITSFLFSYIIIIIILRGALVLFIYIARVASNEKFESPIKNSIIVIFVLFIITYYLNSINFKYFNFNKPAANEYVRLIKIFNTITSNLTLLIIIYLLITIIVVSNIAKTNKGPLRIKI